MHTYLGTPLLFKLLPSGKDVMLIADFEVTVLGYHIVAKTGFISDLTSSPWWAKPIVPTMGLYSPAAVIHDNTYQFKKYARKVCDKIFLQMMKDLGVKKWRRNLMYLAVRVGGKKGYGKQRQR